MTRAGRCICDCGGGGGVFVCIGPNLSDAAVRESIWLSGVCCPYVQQDCQYGLRYDRESRDGHVVSTEVVWLQHPTVLA